MSLQVVILIFFEKNITNLLSALFDASLPSLNVSEFSEKLKSDKKTVVIDVRQPEEYREGHIAGPKLIPLGELVKWVNELPKNKEIICVCASGSRNHFATKMLIDAGFTAINMNGGMFTWQRAGLPVKKGTSA